MIKEGDISILNQLVKALEDSYRKLEKYYEKKDSENFNKVKNEFIQTQRKILEIAGKGNTK